MFCDGRTIPTSGTFQEGGIFIDASLLQDLRTLLSTTYGEDGKLPNLVNRFAGYSATPGASGGSANAVLVAHNHGTGTLAGSTDNPGTHSHSLGITIANTETSGDGVQRNGNFNPFQDNVGTGGEGAHTHSVAISGSTATKGINAAGSNSDSQTGTDANLPPYLGMRPIIKY